METQLLSPVQLAEKLGSTPATLAYWRYMGRGPKFIKTGRNVRYLAADVDKWLEDNRRSQSGNAAQTA